MARINKHRFQGLAWTGLITLALFGIGCASTERTTHTEATLTGDYESKIAAMKKAYEDRLLQAKGEIEKQQQQDRAELAAAKKEYTDRLMRAKADAEAQQQKAREEMNSLGAALSEQLRNNANRQQILISQIEGQTLIEIGGDVLFASGSADLTRDGKTLVRDIGMVLVRFPDYRIRVEGHTDDRLIGSSLKAKFESNWELSAARAATVVRFMADNLQVDPTRFEVAGYGKHRPIADNATEEGRANNRRVEVVIHKEPPKRAPLAGEMIPSR